MQAACAPAHAATKTFSFDGSGSATALRDKQLPQFSRFFRVGERHAGISADADIPV
jgi:hypothetical protein